jgi:hypothetical protein
MQPTTNGHHLQQCIDDCMHCYQACLQTAMEHCLQMGGPHVEPEHFRLMTSCAEICRTAAHFMLSGTQSHAYVCASCTEICTACGDSCEQIGGMDDCVQACRACAQSCHQMADEQGVAFMPRRPSMPSGLSERLPL